MLFVDVVGSTALGGKLEPEDIRLVMDTALAQFTDIVDRHNGRMLQDAGDSLLAAFGTLEVREDDAENAVLAGNLHRLGPDGERQATGCRTQKGAERVAERVAERRGGKRGGKRGEKKWTWDSIFLTRGLARLRPGRIGVAARLKKMNVSSLLTTAVRRPGPSGLGAWPWRRSPISI